MSLNSQQYANLADNVYSPLQTPDSNGDLKVTIEGVTYKILEHMDCPSGYQGTIYQREDTGEIVVAHRGTEQIFKDGVVTDGTMVLALTNRQEAEAVELTRRALEYAKNPNNILRYGHAPEVTVTGHSLGGTLAQITAHRFHLHGETFNAYGAASLENRIPPGGSQVINHVMASDVVSAASPHFGQVRLYATAEEVRVVGERGGYDNDRSRLDVRNPYRAIAGSLGAHSMHNFTHVDGDKRPDRSILADPGAQRLAAEYRPMFDKYRNDIQQARGAISITSSSTLQAQASVREMAGHAAGQGLKGSGHAVGMASHASADSARTATHMAGATAATGVRHAGNTAAGAREAVGALAAGVDHLQGQAQKQGAAFGADLLRRAGGLLPDGAEKWMDAQAGRLQQSGDDAHRRNQTEAAAARRESHEDAAAIRGMARAVASTMAHTATRAGDFQHDSIAGAGQRMGSTLHAAGHLAEAVTRPVTPAGDTQQQAARQAQEKMPSRSPGAPDERMPHAESAVLAAVRQSPAARIDQPGHPGHAMYQQTREHVHDLYREIGKEPDRHADQLAAAAAAQSRSDGLKRVDKIILGDDKAEIFSAHGALGEALTRYSRIHIEPAMVQSLEQSTSRFEQGHAQQQQKELALQQEQQQEQQAQSRSGISR